MKNTIKLPLWLTADSLGAGIALFSSRLFIGIVPITIKICEREIQPSATVFNRLWIAALFLAFWYGGGALYRQFFQERSSQSQAPAYTPEIWGLLFATGLCAAAFQIIWAWSVTQTSVANTSLLHSLTVPFTVVIGWLLFGNRVDWLFLVAMIIAIFGMAVIGLNDFQIDAYKLQGDATALLSALFTALYFLGVERLRVDLGPATILMWSCIIGTIFTLPIILLMHDQLLPSSGQVWISAIVLGLTLAVGQGLIAYSLKHLSSGFVAAVCLLDPILSASFAWAIFAETLNIYNMVGFATILLSLGLTSYSPSIIKQQESG